MGLKDNKYILNKLGYKFPTTEEIIIAKTIQKSYNTKYLYYKFSAIAISSFIEKYSKNKQNIDIQKTVEYVKELCEKYEDNRIQSLFAKELSEVIEKVLQNRNIIELTNSEDPYDIVENIINNFTIEFEKKYIYTHHNFLLEKLGINFESEYYLTLSIHFLEYIFILLIFLVILKIDRFLRRNV